MKPDRSRETAFADLVDRVIAWPQDGPHFPDATFALSSGTRLAVLETLIAAKGSPLHIQEIARRVGIDASPVRQHLEVLVKAQLAEEEPRTVGRERRFSTRVTGIKIVVEGALRAAAAPIPDGKDRPKSLRRIDSRVEELKEKMMKLRVELAKVERQRTQILGETTRSSPPQ